MSDNKNAQKLSGAIKWPIISEILAKMIAPITQMVIARILAPEVFGMFATVTVIKSFVDIFADAGFSTYMVQHEFANEEERTHASNATFTVSFLLSLLLYITLAVLAEPVCVLMGNPGMGLAVAVLGLTLPVGAVSAVQSWLCTRDFDFKAYFIIRMITLVMTPAVTIPLALLTASYWPLIINTLAIQIAASIAIYRRSAWKPKFLFDIKLFKEVTRFSALSLAERISGWLFGSAETMIVSVIMGDYLLGLYRTGQNLSNQILSIVLSPVSMMFFPMISRLQTEKDAFRETLLTFQRATAMLVIPMGFGVYLYRDFVLRVFLGWEWFGASDMLGYSAIVAALSSVFFSYGITALRGQGKLHLPIIAGWLNIPFTIAAILLNTGDFAAMSFWVSAARLEIIPVALIMLYKAEGIGPLPQIRATLPAFISCGVMYAAGTRLRLVNPISDKWQFVSIAICAVIYFAVLMLFPSYRAQARELIITVKSKLKSKFKGEKT